MEQLINFKKLQTPKTKLERNIYLAISQYNVKGDWLNGIPTLQKASNFISSTLDENYINSPKYWQHKPLVLLNDAQGVWVVRITNSKEVKMWGFTAV